MDLSNFNKQSKHNIEQYQKLINIALPLIKDYNKVYKKLTTTETDTLTMYKDSGYRFMNKLLKTNGQDILATYPDGDDIVYNILHGRSKKAGKISLIKILELYYNEILRNIKVIDGVVSRYKLKNKIKVYRGSSCMKEFDNLVIGDDFKFKSFLSTSLDINVATNFISHRTGERIKCLIELTLPKGTNVCYLNWEVDHLNSLKNELLGGSEFEILLGRDYVFKLTNVVDIDTKDLNLTWRNTKVTRRRKNKTKTKNIVMTMRVFQFSYVKVVKDPLPKFDKTLENHPNIDYKNIINFINPHNLFYLG